MSCALAVCTDCELTILFCVGRDWFTRSSECDSAVLDGRLGSSVVGMIGGDDMKRFGTR